MFRNVLLSFFLVAGCYGAELGVIEKSDDRWVLKLSDGSSWVWSPNGSELPLLEEWVAGDEIEVIHDDAYGFLLFNQKSDIRHFPQVFVSSTDGLPLINRVFCHVIKLDDGSCWEFNTDKWMLWQENDPVVILKDEIFNLNLKDKAKARKICADS